jgi:phage shock protein A
MGLWRRLKLAFRSPPTEAPDRPVESEETLAPYERQLELLEEMRRGIADVAAARERLDLQELALHRSASGLDRADTGRRLEELQAKRGRLDAQEARLLEGSRRVEARIRSVRTGVSGETGASTDPERRDDDRNAHIQARAGALEELIASGDLEDLLEEGQSDDG